MLFKLRRPTEEQAFARLLKAKIDQQAKERLSYRQSQILVMLAAGYKQNEIADMLNCTPALISMEKAEIAHFMPAAFETLKELEEAKSTDATPFMDAWGAHLVYNQANWEGCCVVCGQATGSPRREFCGHCLQHKDEPWAQSILKQHRRNRYLERSVPKASRGLIPGFTNLEDGGNTRR